MGRGPSGGRGGKSRVLPHRRSGPFRSISGERRGRWEGSGVLTNRYGPLSCPGRVGVEPFGALQSQPLLRRLVEDHSSRVTTCRKRVNRDSCRGAIGVSVLNVGRHTRWFPNTLRSQTHGSKLRVEVVRDRRTGTRPVNRGPGVKGDCILPLLLSTVKDFNNTPNSPRQRLLRELVPDDEFTNETGRDGPIRLLD